MVPDEGDPIATILALAEQIKREQLEEFNAPRFALSAITAGLNIPEVTIRNWLTRKQIELGASIGHERGKWRLFSIRDVLVISTCFELSRLGVPVTVFAKVYSVVASYAEAMFTRPMGMVSHPVGLLSNDGEWKLTRRFDSGPLHPTDGDAPAMSILIDFDKIILGTLNRLGLNARVVRPSDLGEGN